MIKIENVVLPSAEQWKAIIMGTRNPMNSWDRSDSFTCETCKWNIAGYGIDMAEECEGCTPSNSKYEPKSNEVVLGKNDLSLMMRLAKAGTDHRKFMRMIPVYMDITAPLYFFKELSTYRIGVVQNSCSTMHKIHEKEFTLDDFSHEHLNQDVIDKPLKTTIDCLNFFRELYLQHKDKDDWWQMIQLLPSSYNQKRTVMLNYEVLANIYKARKNHKLDEWHDFCDWIETLPYSQIITGKESEEDNEVRSNQS